MLYLSRQVNTVGLREVTLSTTQEREDFVGSPLITQSILDDIYIWYGATQAADTTLDNVNLILRFGEGEAASEEFDQYIYGPCFFAAAADENGQPTTLSQEQMRKLLSVKVEAKLVENGHRVWVLLLNEGDFNNK